MGRIEVVIFDSISRTIDNQIFESRDLFQSNPIGTIFSSLFISHISVGGAYLPTKYFPSEIADLISGIIIYLCAFSMLFRTLFEKKLIHKKDTANANAEPAAKAVTKPEKEGK